MAQFPPASHWARRSQSESGAAFAVPVAAIPATPMMAPVTATLATVRPVVVGLRWRPLMMVEILSTRACEVSCRVRAERSPGLAFPGWKGSGFTPRFGLAIEPVSTGELFCSHRGLWVPRPRPWNALSEVRYRGTRLGAAGRRWPSFPAENDGNGSSRSCHHLITRRGERRTTRHTKRRRLFPGRWGCPSECPVVSVPLFIRNVSKVTRYAKIEFRAIERCVDPDPRLWPVSQHRL